MRLDGLVAHDQAASGLTLLMTFLACSASSTQGSGGGGDMVFTSVSGTMLGQIAVVALAVVASHLESPP